jgi:hypothetical protein
VVDQNSASWNQLSGWLREIAALRGGSIGLQSLTTGSNPGARNRGSLSLLFLSPWAAVGGVETRRRGFQAAVGAFLASTAAARSTALSRRRPSRAGARERLRPSASRGHRWTSSSKTSAAARCRNRLLISPSLVLDEFLRLGRIYPWRLIVIYLGEEACRTITSRWSTSRSTPGGIHRSRAAGSALL